VKVWSLSARKEVASLAGHTSCVRSVAFSPDGQHIVSGSYDKLVKVCYEWNFVVLLHFALFLI
jgi:WD40 repeat protein